MRLIIFGASGGCGRWLVRQAVARGYEVTAVTRDASRHAVPDGARVVTGEVADKDFVTEVARDHDAVLSCLGLRRASLFPWAKLLSPTNLVETFTRNLREAEPKRVIWISAGGVGESRQRTTRPVRAMIRAGNVGVAYRDLEAAEALMQTEETGWLAVRPVTLTNGAPTGRAGPVTRYGLASTIRRSDVATWMLNVADGSTSYPEPAVLLGTSRARGTTD